MKRVAVIALGGAIVWSLLIAAPAAEVERILCFGDSITQQKGWVLRVGLDPSLETINAGRSGRKAAEAPLDLAASLQKHKDLDRVILFLGVNDLPARDPRPGDVKVDASVEAMDQAIDVALTRFDKDDIILVAPCSVNPSRMPPRILAKGYQIAGPLLEDLEDGYQELARKRGVRFLSLFEVVRPENLPDGLHPDTQGHQQIADAILDFLKR